MTKKPPVEFITTGCDMYDLVLGGGYIQGGLINIVGDKSTGKSLLATECVAANRDVPHQYFDEESGAKFDTQAVYGMDIYAEVVPETLEEFAYSTFPVFYRDKNQSLTVVDSYDALQSKAARIRQQEEEQRYKKNQDPDPENKGSYKLEKPKLLKEFLGSHIVAMQKKKATLIFISQLIANLDNLIYKPKHKRTGGKALDFYSSQIIWLREVEKHFKKGRAIGVTVEIRTEKCRSATPFRSCYIQILFGYGVDNVTTNLLFLYDMYTAKEGKLKKSATVVWDGVEMTLDQAVEHIEVNNQEAELKKRIVEKWHKIENEIGPGKRKRKY